MSKVAELTLLETCIYSCLWHYVKEPCISDREFRKCPRKSVKINVIGTSRLAADKPLLLT